MKPAAFAYARPRSLDEALAALASGPDVKILAGGQSLVPMLNMRLARPAMLVDINALPGLDTIEVGADGGLLLGALVRHHVLATAPLVAERAPLLAEAARHVGHRAIRNRGTLGGSLAHADPAAEIPAAAVALGAVLEVVGPAGRRRLPAEDLVVGPLTTVLGAREILVRVHLPGPGPQDDAPGGPQPHVAAGEGPPEPRGGDPGPASPGAGRRAGWGFAEVARRSGDFALAGVAVVLHAATGDDTNCTGARIVAFGAGPGPLRLASAEAVVVGRRLGAALAREAGAAAAAGCDPEDDVHASAAYRRHLVGVLTEQALLEAADRLARGRGAQAPQEASRPGHDHQEQARSRPGRPGHDHQEQSQPAPGRPGRDRQEQVSAGTGRARHDPEGGGETVTVRLVVNGRAVERPVAPRRSLADFLRDDLGLTGTHVGCEHGVCGACTVLVNGHTARSCLLLAVQLEGAHVTTIEGLTPDAGLSPLQQAFRESHALQCGFCTPGMIAAAHELLAEHPGPTREEIREALGGNLCMCTGYVNIVNAVERAAALLRGETATMSPHGPHEGPPR